MSCERDEDGLGHALLSVKAQWEKGWLEGGSFQWFSDNGKTPLWQPLAAAATVSHLDALPRRNKVQQAHK